MTNKLILGTVQFGLDYGINNTLGKPTTQNIKNILDVAYANGINILDTAEAYGNSQEQIGEYHKNSPNTFNVITKFSSSVTNLSENILERVQQNIKLLNINKLYCYMFHSFKDFITYFSTFKNDLIQLQNNGLIQKLGVSVYTNVELESVLQTPEIQVVQLPFNLLDNDTKRGQTLKKAQEKGVEIHTRSAFLQGLFFKSLHEIPEKLKPLQPYLEKIEAIKKELSLSTETISIQYPLQKTYINNVLIGVDSVGQLQSNIKNSIAKVAIAEADIDAINVKENLLLNPSNWK